MSEREFENYLALLTRLLRLNGQQTSALSAELRAHMEDRLEELESSGVLHEDAVRQALAEFGDAAGLAHQFSDVSLQRKRRWIVRLTTFSLAAACLFALGLITFWPGRNAAPGVAAVVAQVPKPPGDPFQPPAVAPEVPPASKATGQRKSASAMIEERLNQTSTLDVVEMPLRDVVQFLSESHKLPIVLKLKPIEEANVPSDTPISKCLRGVSLATVLDIVLDDLGLTYYFNEVLFITTPKDSQFRAEVRIYDCRDILSMPATDGGNPERVRGSGGFGGNSKPESERRAEQLIQIIKTNIDQDTWFDGSATPRVGSISEFNGLVVVTQTAQTHRRIEHLLNMLREAAGLDVAKAAPVVR